MSIATQLTALNADVIAARAAITAKGGTVTVNGGSSQLAADIATIPSGGGASLDDVFLYVLDFATDSITMTNGGMNKYAGFFTT